MANANSDTVTAIDTQAKAAKETILVRPDPTFPYGSAADGLALSPDGKNLFVASGGNNAVAVVELPNAQHTNSLRAGLCPHRLVSRRRGRGQQLRVCGQRQGPGQPRRASRPLLPGKSARSWARRTESPSRTPDSLSKLTAQAYEDGRVPQIKQTQQPPLAGQAPVPVPLRVGEPSVFQHVLYILKENKTYDQVFGDMPEGNGNPGLCIYPAVRLAQPSRPGAAIRAAGQLTTAMASTRPTAIPGAPKATTPTTSRSPSAVSAAATLSATIP